MAQPGSTDGNMLIWVCALHCEAKPVIDRFRLKKSHARNAFDLYLGDEIACVISGIGNLASAAATAWVAAKHDQVASIAWINLGIAGGLKQPLGKIYRINQVLHQQGELCYYPHDATNTSIASATCISIDQPSTNYHQQHLFDMESIGFHSSATRFSSLELIQCLKVISDNEQNNISIDRPQISELIHQQIDLIEKQAKALIQVNQGLIDREIAEADWHQILSISHFSQTQQNRMRGLLRYLLNRSFSANEIFEQLGQQASAKAMIERMEELSAADSQGL